MATAKPPDYPAVTPEQLGQLLRGFRRQHKLSQQRAAEAGGLLPKTISSLETRPQHATVESLYRLLSALGVELVLRPKQAPGRSGSW